MDKSCQTIKSLLDARKGALTLLDYHRMGQAVREYLGAHKRYGNNALAGLSKGTGMSVRFLGQAAEFALWDKEEVKELSRRGVKWRYIVTVFPYARRAAEVAELARREKSSALARQARMLDRQRRAFLRQAERARLWEFEEAVRDWRQAHLDLWGTGDKGRWNGHALRRIRRGIAVIEQAVQEIETLGAKAMAECDVSAMHRLLEEMRESVSSGRKGR